MKYEPEKQAAPMLMARAKEGGWGEVRSPLAARLLGITFAISQCQGVVAIPRGVSFAPRSTLMQILFLKLH